MKIHYVYILESISTPEHFYIGYTRDLRGRVQKHQADVSSHAAKYRPGKLKAYLLSKPRKIAGRFERYLKSGSGRAFSKSHLCDSATSHRPRKRGGAPGTYPIGRGQRYHGRRRLLLRILHSCLFVFIRIHSRLPFVVPIRHRKEFSLLSLHP
jgi:putative endonuclease